MSDTKTIQEFTEQIERDLADAIASRQFMVAIFSVEAGQVHMQRHSWQFPPGDHHIALDLLRRSLPADVNPDTPPEPLPIAAIFGEEDEAQ